MNSNNRGFDRWIGLFTHKGHAKNLPHLIILALQLVGSKFNCLLTINFLRFNPKNSNDSMSMKLGLVSNYEKIKV